MAGLAKRRKLSKVARGRQGDHLTPDSPHQEHGKTAVEVKANGGAFEFGIPQQLFTVRSISAGT